MSDDELRCRLLAMSSEERRAALEWLRAEARRLGVPVDGEQPPRKRQPSLDSNTLLPSNPEQVPHRSQKRIDATAATLLEDIDM